MVYCEKNKLLITFLLTLIITLVTYSTAYSSTVLSSSSELKSQKDIRDVYELIIKDVSEKPDSLYGGSFIDSTNVLNIGIKNYDEKTINHLRKLFKDNGTVKFWNAKYTYKELNNKMKELNILNEELNKNLGESNPIVDFGISEKHNKIIITLKRNAEDSRKLVLNAVGNDISIEFRQGDISLTARTDNFRPLIGGIKVTNSSGATSTTGFGAIKPDGKKS